MKELLKKAFNKSLTGVVLTILVIFLLAEFIIFPALTAADTLANLLGVLGGVFILAYIYYFAKSCFIIKENEPGETELDYIPKPKAKRNPKQFDGVKNDEPFVKTRKKSVTKKVK